MAAFLFHVIKLLYYDNLIMSKVNLEDRTRVLMINSRTQLPESRCVLNEIDWY